MDLIKSLYGLKQTPKQFHQKFNEVVLSSSYLLNQADKCVYSKFDESGPDIAFAVGKLSRYTCNHILEGYTNTSWISNTEDNSSTSGWVFLLGGGARSWASKKTIESEFVALAARKEAKWLRNMILEIPLWSKPIAPISIQFVRSQQNLADHLTKGLARDLVLRSAEGIG
ncbi:zinc finger, CCHC-type containing protein [Tanacetum coccineum]